MHDHPQRINLSETFYDLLRTYKREDELKKTFNSRYINNYFNKHLIDNKNYKYRLRKFRMIARQRSKVVHYDQKSPQVPT